MGKKLSRWCLLTSKAHNKKATVNQLALKERASVDVKGEAMHVDAVSASMEEKQQPPNSLSHLDFLPRRETSLGPS